MEPHVKPDAGRGLRQVLGDLEAEVMEILWEEGSGAVRTVHDRLAQRREIAYTTVMTVMSRLVEKGILVRRQEGRAYIYAPHESRDSFCANVVKNVMAGLFGDATRPALAHFVQNLSEDDIVELDELARIIDQKRKERESSSSSSSA